MPKPLDISGLRFGRLKVIRRADETSKHGKTRWHCVCDCGCETIVVGAQLRSGNTKSCGCLQASARCGIPFTKKLARDEHKKKESINENGEEWLAPRLAARYIAVNQSTLKIWAKRCPWLNGRPVQTRCFPGGYNRTITYYLKRDLDQVGQAQAERCLVPEVPDHVYVEDAATAIGISIRTLRRLLKAKGVKIREETAKSKDGRALPRSYVPQWFVDECKRERSLELTEDDISVCEAAEILGMSTEGVHSLIFRKILEPRAGKIHSKGGYPRKGLLLSRSKVEEYKEEQIKKYGPNFGHRWTLGAIRLFVSTLQGHLHAFTPAELYLLFQQTGLLQMQGKGKVFVKALATGRFPKEEIEKFTNAKPSLVDQFVQDPTQTLETLEAKRAIPDRTEEAALDQADAKVQDVSEEAEPQLPVVETKDVLASLGIQVISSADEEAVEFLIASGIAKIWKHAYRDEATAVAQAEAFRGEGYAEEIRKRFLDEYRQVKDLAIPEGYAFRINGEMTPPNLMQRHFAVRVQQRKRVGNWSGTGAGKTLAAVLATRVVASKLTVICCPNSVVEGWRRAIWDIFPDSIVATKTFAPDWTTPSPRPSLPRGRGSAEGHRYLILNYEAFQQPDSAERVRSLAAGEPIDFVIVDEIHYAKQRSEDISQRRHLVAALTTLAAERNPDLHVLGMSATPVINNLQEGKSMVELVTGLAHDELDTRPTVPNCMALHQRLVTLGIRWMPEYQLGYEQRELEVDCSPFLDEIRALGGKGTPLALEQILTRARLPVIRAHVEPKTIIYTHYVQGIDRLLRDALVEDGWKVGFYTGEDKSGLDGFLEGDVDVLIGSSAIGTGVDGLQQVCNRLIVNVLPWTAAEFEQLKGRIYRQGQRRENVTLILPLTCAEVHGERWSWCQSKMQRLRFKKSIADAAVDGVVPEGHLRTPAQAYQDVMAWLERLEAGEVEVIARPRIVVPLPDTDPADVKRRRRLYGDFSTMNRTWNQGRSEGTHARLQANPEEWAQYHTLYREARKDWAVVPYEEMIRWCRQRNGYVIGDFGCGEAKLAESVSDRHTVHSFDHVAINENVVACDMAHVPLDDDTLDVAIFSLSLMGANFADYLREAYRTLKLDGQLHILEATERFSDRNAFAKELEALGFAIISVEDKWKFTHIRALKTERHPREDIELRFG